MADRLELEARFNDKASAGVKRLGKTLGEVRPSNGMQAAQKWMGDFRSAADKANVAVRPLATGLSAVGIGGLAASLSMGELVRQFKDLADSTLTMRELGRQSRMSATEIARLQYAAGKLHVDPAAVGGAISGWSSKMVEFRRHTGRFYTELLRQNSDVARKIAADNPVDGLKDTLDFLSRIKDPQIQKRWAEEAGVGDLTPMLGKGPQGLAEAFADAAREVKPISAELQQAADRFNDATNRFNQSWSNLKNDIGPAVLDPLTHVIDKLDDALKLVAASPGDAAAGAAVIAGSFAAFWVRARIMRGLKLAGAGAEGVELAGAAREQVKAGGSLIEAAIALKEAAAELRGKGGGGGGGPTPPEEERPGAGGAWRKALPALATAGTLAAVGAGIAYVMLNRDQSKSLVDGGRPDVEPQDNNLGLPGVDTPSASDKWQVPARYSTEARARDDARGVTSFDGNALHRNDEMPVAGLHAAELFATVRQGSKEGIVAGLREMAQQNELEGGAAGNSFGVKSSSGGLGGSGRHLDGGGHPGGGAIPGASLGDHARGGIGKGAVALAPRAREAFEFWKSKGLTPEQSAGLVGMEQGESMADPNNKSGDGGQAHGAFQWHANRRRDIMAGAGIDIDHATHRQQLEAAYWEFQHTESAAWAQVKRAQTATDSARAGTTFFERPGDKRGQSIVRGGMAEGWLKRFNDEDVKAKAPAGAGTPAPSGAAVGDAAVLAARQRMLNGGRDPKDRELIDRYKAQQAQPEKHAAGGWIKGRGHGTSDSIPAWLSSGEFVVNAKASSQWLPLLHAINGGKLPGFAQGGPVGPPPLVVRPKAWVPPAGFGVAKAFYPTSSPGISDAEGAVNRRFWRDFMRKPQREGGMGAPWRTTLAALAMMQGESGRGLNSKSYGWDVNGPSGGVDQLHDVTVGKYAGRLHRLSDLMTMGMQQHADWRDPYIQAANFKKEALGSMNFAWRRMLAAKTARGALKEGIDKFENPAQHDLELLRRMPNLVRLQREAVADGAAPRQAMDPLDVTIRHHPHTGHPIVTAKAGRGVRLGIRSGPTMQPT